MTKLSVSIVSSAVAIVTLLGAAWLLHSGAGASEALGDVNCSGFTDAIDATIILLIHADIAYSGRCTDDGDVSKDGNTDSIDAALILQARAGLIPDYLYPTSTPTGTPTPTVTPTTCPQGGCPTPTPTRTPTPLPLGAQFSLGIDIDGDGEEDCSTKAGDNRVCLVFPPRTITAIVRLDALPSGVASYGGYDVVVGFEDMSLVGEPDPRVWPDCVFDVWFQSFDFVAFSCAIGIPPAGPSTYIGALGTLQFELGYDCWRGAPSISLRHGSGNTSIAGIDSVSWYEVASGVELPNLKCAVE